MAAAAESINAACVRWGGREREETGLPDWREGGERKGEERGRRLSGFLPLSHFFSLTRTTSAALLVVVFALIIIIIKNNFGRFRDVM